MKLPHFIHRHLAHRPLFQKALANTGWLFSGSVLRMGMGLLVGVWVARYLGPEQFGLFNYVIAFVALFGAIATLGLHGIVVRDLIQQPENARAILGTAFVLHLIGGLLAYSITVIAISFVRPNDALAKGMVVVLGFVMVLKATEVIKYWFESLVHSKYTVLAENAAFLLFSGVKVALILNQASLNAFVWAAFGEAALVAISLLGIYSWREGHLRSWRLQTQRANTLLKDSWPLVLSGLTVLVYMRIDQIMLGQMMDDEAVGIYSAAVRVSELWYFIPTAIVASMFPTIIDVKKHSEALYYRRLQQLFDFMAILALSVAIPMTFLSGWVIDFLYGNAYQQAGPVLSVLIWAGLFVFLGIAGSNWFLLEGLQVYALYRTLAGAITNVALNLLLIPKYGIIGAALATVIAQAVSCLLFNFAAKRTRNLFYMYIRSIACVKIFSSINFKIFKKPLDKRKTDHGMERNFVGQQLIVKKDGGARIIIEALNSATPKLVARFGTTELSVLYYFEHHKKSDSCDFPDYLKKNIADLSGFFPATDEMLVKFCEEFKKCLNNIDVLGVRTELFDECFWEHEEYACRRFCLDAKYVGIEEIIAPFFHAKPWMSALEGKNVLVIHPFEQTIVRQFEKRTLLFDNNLILPSFTLKTLRAVQSLADEKNGLPFSNWFDALNSMKSKMEHIDFDVAIIGAGAYGFFLAEHCKSLGKTAIHMGGATQVLFGIKGKRWEDPTSNDCLTDLMNKYWVYPSELERPKGASRVENGCYW